MTYMIGFTQPGINAIISDTRINVQSDPAESHNHALKTGLFFPGCIFGRVGNELRSAEFINAFRSNTNVLNNEPSTLWSELEQFAKSYNFHQGTSNYFLLLLSERTSGQPVFYSITPSNRLERIQQEHQNGFFVFGSGRRLLDQYMRGKVGYIVSYLKQALVQDHDWPSENASYITPYVICHLLSEASLTSEASVLEDVGVGGLFHFIFQTQLRELAQRPSVYVNCGLDPSNSLAVAWTTRVSYTVGGLCLEFAQDSPKRHFVFDEISRPDIANIERQQLRFEIEQDLKRQPYFFYCGVGYVDPSRRKHFSFGLSEHGKIEDIFDGTGKLSPDLSSIINVNFFHSDD